MGLKGMINKTPKRDIITTTKHTCAQGICSNTLRNFDNWYLTFLTELDLELELDLDLDFVINERVVSKQPR